MQSIFSNALSGAVSKHIELPPTRRETLAWLKLSIMQQLREEDRDMKNSTTSAARASATTR